MAPKSSAPLNESDIKFLGLAFKHLKEKPNVDFDGLANESGMSKGGASNKFRDLKRRLDDMSGPGGDSDTASNSATPVSTPKPRVKKSKPAKKTAPTSASSEEEMDSKPAKKAKTTKSTTKKPSTAKKTAANGKKPNSNAVHDEIVKGEEDANTTDEVSTADSIVAEDGDFVATFTVDEEDEQD